MKLLLTSNGFTPEIEKEFYKLLTKAPEENSVAFITTAAFGEPESEEWNGVSWLEEYRNELRNRKITRIEDLDLKDKTEEDLRKIMSSKDIIFVNGGNTFYLMHWVQKSGFKNAIKSFLDREEFILE